MPPPLLLRSRSSHLSSGLSFISRSSVYTRSGSLSRPMSSSSASASSSASHSGSGSTSKNDAALNTIPNPLPAAFLRGGTSKGVFINSKHLPGLVPSLSLSPSTQQSAAKSPEPTQPKAPELNAPPPLTPLLLGLMGSPDPYARQLNGMGGGISSLSKVMLVGALSPSSRAVIEENSRNAGRVDEDVEVEYTFVQVGITDPKIDISGNCGNLSAMVGVFAVDEGLVDVRALLESTSSNSSTSTSSPTSKEIKTVTIKAFNTNTQKIISTTFPISSLSGVPLLELPQTTMAGVSGTASEIVLNFERPAGARTGRLMPTGNAVDTVYIAIGEEKGREKVAVRVSLMDATNPTVFTSKADLEALGLPVDAYLRREKEATGVVGTVLEAIRREGARMMGLDERAEAQPKIAMLSAPVGVGNEDKNDAREDGREDIVIHALSMGVLHKAVPMTVGLCLGVAAGVRGSLAWEIVNGGSRREESKREMVRIRHPGGCVDVKPEFEEPQAARVGENGGEGGEEGEVGVRRVGVVRTGRRLMRGEVFW
ncbi:PrpF protein [Panaeolus papilionaceus]|nr:PrpF protein [Panaeolus papilionaceus]